jgi:hypothetical protein
VLLLLLLLRLLLQARGDVATCLLTGNLEPAA